MDNLINQLLSGDDEQAELAARELAEQGQAALGLLTPLTQSSDPNARWWGARAATLIASPQTPNILLPLLDDPNPEVRQCATLGMATHPLRAAIPKLVATLGDTDRLLARLAANALIAHGDDAVAPLIAAIENGSQRAKSEAVRALAEIADGRAIPIFFTIIQNGDAPVTEHWAERGLEKLGVGMTFFKPE